VNPSPPRRAARDIADGRPPRLSRIRIRNPRILRPRLVAALAALTVGLTTLAACGGGSSTVSETTSSGVPSTIRIADDVAVPSLSPVVDGAYEEVQLTYLLGGFLTTYGTGNAGGQPELAQSLTQSADRLTWTVTLRPNLKFSNGTPLRASDVVASFDQLLATPGLRTDLFIGPLIGPLKSVTATSAQTIVFKLTQPDPNFPKQLAEPDCAIYPAADLAKGTSFFNKPVSAGRYRLQSANLVTGRFVFTANPYYYGPALKVKQVIVTTVPDAATRLAEVKSGQVDYAENLPGNMLSQISGGLRVDAAPWPGGELGLAVNFRNPIVSNPKVREAMSLALNRSQIVTDALGGNAIGVPLSGIPWDQTGQPPNSPTSAPDLTAAKKLLAGTPCAHGCTIPLIVRPDAVWELPVVSTVVQQQLKAVGINIEIKNVPNAQYNTAIQTNDFGLSMLWIGYYDDGENYLGSVFLDPQSGINRNYDGPNSGITSSAMSALAGKINLAPAGELPGLISQANTLYAQNLPLIPLTTLTYIAASRLPASVLTNVQAAYLKMP
jgi:peptide/nickel transport system substrate-binding protein